ncbi:MAG: S8 family serine peptidase [Caldithrix sp.]|nr:S8 family serine peptidase [Caldithrix sp.]
MRREWFRNRQYKPMVAVFPDTLNQNLVLRLFLIVFGIVQNLSRSRPEVFNPFKGGFMKNFVLTLLLCIGVSFMGVSAQDADIRYAQTKISIKLTRTALAAADPGLYTSGRMGIAAIDSLNALRDVARVERHFPHIKHKGTPDKPVTLDAWFKLHFLREVDVQTIAAEYDALIETIHGEAIAIVPLYRTPDDPDYGTQWHLHQSNDADVDAPEAWDIDDGSSDVIVAMMDTGVRWYHKDLAGSNADENDRNSILGNIWINQDEMSNTNSGVDEDGNGYNDDWVGWDFVTEILPLGNDDYDIEDNDPRDYNGHGTHCGGNIGAINNNGRGVSSVTGGWGEDGTGNGNGVKVMCLRIGYDYSGLGYVSMDFAANAFNYAADNGAFAASCSWESSSNSALQDAIEYFVYNTTSPDTANDPRYRLIFKAAGNDNSTTPDFMEERTDVITVAGTNESDSEYSSTAYGYYVDISAPATNIYSTYHNSSSPGTDDYASLTGTSMATPIAASVAALIKSRNPNLTAVEVEQMLYDTADDIEANLSSGYTGNMGAGRVNAYNAVYQSDQSLPVELTSFTAEAGNGLVVLRWQTASELNNMGFNVYRSASKKGAYRQIASFENHPDLQGLGTHSQGKAYRLVDTDVQNGQSYWYHIEDVDYNGRPTRHQTVKAAPLADHALNREVLAHIDEFMLTNNYPNPFNPLTRFVVNIPDGYSEAVEARITVYNIRGQVIKQLYEGPLGSGQHLFRWDGTDKQGLDAPSGTYFYALRSQPFNRMRKMMLIR